MTKEERVELLEEARECIKEAVDKIQEALEDTGEMDRAKVYIIPSLEMCASEEHGYLGSQPSNIDELVRAIEENEELEDD